MVEIRRCTAADVEALATFIDEHWQRGHVLARSRALLDWQHREPDGSYNFLMAWDGGTLLGVLGYIPTRRYDAALAGANLLWLALWKTRDDARVAGLGLRLLHELAAMEPHAAIGVSGIRLAHPPIYRALGYRVGELTQHYAVSPSAPRRLIAAAAAVTWPYPRSGDASFVELDEVQLRQLRFDSRTVPHKTPVYFAERFLRHPFYRYRVFLLSGGGRRGLLATRLATHDDAAALRLVDFAGDMEVLARSGTGLGALMQESAAEYADLWHWGLPAGVLERAGFARVDPAGPVIVPNYFEPFLARNGRILCAIKAPGGAVPLVLRADGDQDRPNVLP